MIRKALILFFALTPRAVAGGSPGFVPESLVPAYIPVSRPALVELTAGLRAKRKTLGLDGIKGPGGKVSRAVLLLPRDRSGAGVLSFEIEGGDRAGVWQCEALGRGLTSPAPRLRWVVGMIGGTTIYYAPEDEPDGATIPGVYDLTNISPVNYDIQVLGKPEPRVLALTARPEGALKGKRRFSGVWEDWYPPGYDLMPVDLVWAADSQAGTQGEGIPVFDRTAGQPAPELGSVRARQLAANPLYYSGPYGRYGFAVHTDLWEDPVRLADPAYAGRPEAADFRWRDTDGCLKLRPACLALFNRFISEQSGKGRRTQLLVRETPLLDGLPSAPPAAGGK